MKTNFLAKSLWIGTLFFFICAGCAAPETPTVEATATPPSPTSTPVPPTSTPQSLAGEISSYLDTLAERDIIRGSVLVAKEGEILLSEGYGLADRENKIPNTSQTKFRIASLTKQFTAMGILILQSRAQLDVQDRICEYLPACPEIWSSITIHHLLTHTSGIPEWWEIGLDFDELESSHPPPIEVIEIFMQYPLEFQPGEQWAYCNVGYDILGYIIEQRSNQPYEEFLQQAIFEPLAMINTGMDQKDEILAIGYNTSIPVQKTNLDYMWAYSSGGLYSTVEDLYRWERALNTDRLVPQEFLDMIFTPYAAIPETQLSYGYGWFIGEDHDQYLCFHGGEVPGFLSQIRRYPDDDVTIIVISNKQTADLNYVVRGIEEIIFRE
jgi:CubicO group peptidase (beta-lactamase class C family)